MGYCFDIVSVYRIIPPVETERYRVGERFLVEIRRVIALQVARYYQNRCCGIIVLTPLS